MSAAVQEGTRFVGESLLEFKAAISEETGILLKRTQDLISHNENILHKQISKIRLETSEIIKSLSGFH